MIFMTRCINMLMSLNGIEHMYTVTVKLHRMIYMEFHARSINMPMNFNGTEHMYIVTARVHMMFYKTLCLIVLRYLYVPKGWKCLYLSILGL
jgi:hypothetical protein